MSHLTVSLTLIKSLLVLVGIASVTPAKASEQGTLKISPQMCVVEKGQQHCKTLLTVNYENTRVVDFCIVIEKLSVNRCYQEQSTQVFTIDLTTQQSLLVKIVDPKTKAVLQQESLDVIVFKPKTRKRRSFGWNFL